MWTAKTSLPRTRERSSWRMAQFQARPTCTRTAVWEKKAFASCSDACISFFFSSRMHGHACVPTMLLYASAREAEHRVSAGRERARAERVLSLCTAYSRAGGGGAPSPSSVTPRPLNGRSRASYEEETRVNPAGETRAAARAHLHQLADCQAPSRITLFQHFLFRDFVYVCACVWVGGCAHSWLGVGVLQYAKVFGFGFSLPRREGYPFEKLKYTLKNSHALLG